MLKAFVKRQGLIWRMVFGLHPTPTLIESTAAGSNLNKTLLSMSWTIKFRAKKTGLALKYVPPSQYSYTKKALIPFVLFDIQ